MARKRMLSPDVWSDGKTIRLNNDELLFFVGMISMSDDEAIVEADPDSLHFRLARQEFSPEKIEDLLRRLNDEGMIVQYNGYAFLPNFFKHQTLNRPTMTKLRRPPAEIVRQYPEYIEAWKRVFKQDEYPFTEDSLNTHGVLTEDSRSTHSERKGREGKVNDKQLTRTSSPPKDNKTKYADHVTLTEKEYEALVNDFGKEIADKAIEKLSDYKGSKGKRYKSDYHTIRNWGIDSAKEKLGKDRGSQEETDEYGYPKTG